MIEALYIVFIMVHFALLMAFLMGLSAFGAGWLMLQLKDKQSMRSIKMVMPNNGDGKVQAEIEKGGTGFGAFNIEEPPVLESQSAKRFTHSEELKRATKS